MSVAVTTSTVRAILKRAGFTPAVKSGSGQALKSGFVVKVFRRDGEEYQTFHGVRHHLDYAVEVRHAFGEEAKNVEVEMVELKRYAAALSEKGWKAQIRVYGAALGERLTSRFVEVG